MARIAGRRANVAPLGTGRRKSGPISNGSDCFGGAIVSYREAMDGPLPHCGGHVGQ
jgi:hypothetical protein